MAWIRKRRRGRARRTGVPEPGVARACSALVEALRAGEQPAAERACEALIIAARSADAQDLTLGARVLAAAVTGLPSGPGSMAAPLLGSLVQAGGDPATLEPLTRRVAEELELVATFVDVWRSAAAPRGVGDGGDERHGDERGGDERQGGEDPDGGDLPDPEQDETDVAATRGRLREAGAARGMGVETCDRLTLAWFTVGQWVQGLLIPLQLRQVRGSLAHRERLTAATTAAVDADNATWLLGLLLTLDDEPLVVLHRPSGRGYRLTMSGIGDNFQLHTLLAAALIGSPGAGLIDGERPDPSWVLAASDGPPVPPGGIRGQFDLVDAFGARIRNEGRPADIPLLDGVRVVVLDPPSSPRSWNAGRAHPLMVPSLTLDEVMPADRAAGWFARIASAAPPFA